MAGKEYIEREATCKDCVHFDVCAEFWYSEFDSTDSLEETKEYRSDQEPCHTFKNKADVAEVVRCKNCRFAKRLANGVKYGLPVCSRLNCEVVYNFYCGFGAKMDGKDED